MSKDTYKKEITENEYLQIVGLVSLGREAYSRMSEVDKALCSVLNYESEYSGNSCGLLSDIYFDDQPDVKQALKNMEVKILKNGRATKHKTSK